MSDTTTAIHALEASTMHRRRVPRTDPEDDKTLEYAAEEGDETMETEGDEPSPSASEDCVTFLIVVAIIAMMIAFFWFVFTHLVAPSDLLSQRLHTGTTLKSNDPRTLLMDS